MDLSKSYEFFKPETIRGVVNIIGCGSVGSVIAENLARCGVEKMTLWDFDIVESKNIVNQMFRKSDVGRNKAEALRDIILEINPEAESSIQVKTNGWNGERLSGHIFLAVDNIDLRREIVQKHFMASSVKSVFDIRTLLTSAQHYAAKWDDINMKKNLLNSMQFTQEEGDAESPVSACGITLGVATTVRLICGFAVNNFINFIKEGKMWKFVECDGFHGALTCF